MNFGLIYKITSDSTDKMYIGSTSLALSTRFSALKANYKKYLKTNKCYSTSYEILKNGNAQIGLIERFDYYDRRELFEKERFYIDLHKNKCVNKNMPALNNEEYHRDYQILYRIKNKERIRQQTKKRYNQTIKCDCGCDVSKVRF